MTQKTFNLIVIMGIALALAGSLWGGWNAGPQYSQSHSSEYVQP